MYGEKNFGAERIYFPSYDIYQKTWNEKSELLSYNTLNENSQVSPERVRENEGIQLYDINYIDERTRTRKCNKDPKTLIFTTTLLIETRIYKRIVTLAVPRKYYHPNDPTFQIRIRQTMYNGLKGSRPYMVKHKEDYSYFVGQKDYLTKQKNLKMFRLSTLHNRGTKIK